MEFCTIRISRWRAYSVRKRRKSFHFNIVIESYNEQTCVATLVEIKLDRFMYVLDQTVTILEDFANIMSLQLLKTFFPRYAFDYKVKLKLGAKSLERAPYRRSSLNLVELRK